MAVGEVDASRYCVAVASRYRAERRMIGLWSQGKLDSSRTTAKFVIVRQGRPQIGLQSWGSDASIGRGQGPVSQMTYHYEALTLHNRPEQSGIKHIP